MVFAVCSRSHGQSRRRRRASVSSSVSASERLKSTGGRGRREGCCRRRGGLRRLVVLAAVLDLALVVVDYLGLPLRGRVAVLRLLELLLDRGLLLRERRRRGRDHRAERLD